MKIGVIGLGSIGMRHAKNLQALGHVIVGYDPIQELREQFPARALGEDAYVIASPTKLHHKHLVECMLIHKPIFVEKPISHVYDSTLGTWGNIFVGYNLRFNSCVHQAREWLRRIGRPLWANFICAQANNKPAYLRDGVILNWSHEIDLALHLLGDAHLETSSTRIVDGCDDMSDILLTHESGCRTHIHLDYITSPEQRTFSIYGERGSIWCDILHRHAICAEGYTNSYKDEKGSFDADYIDEMKAFIDGTQGKQTPGCTGAEALKVLEICIQVRKQAGLE